MSNRKNVSNELIHTDLARSQMSARLGEARPSRREHPTDRAQRLSHRAQQEAFAARLNLARML